MWKQDEKRDVVSKHATISIKPKSPFNHGKGELRQKQMQQESMRIAKDALLKPPSSYSGVLCIQVKEIVATAGWSSHCRVSNIVEIYRRVVQE